MYTVGCKMIRFHMVTSKRSVCLIVFIVDVLPFLKVLQAEKEHTVIDIDGKI